MQQSGRLRDAELLYRQVIELDPGHTEAMQNLGAIAYQTGHTDAAMELFRDALRLNPRSPEARSNLGLALMQLGDVAGALESFERAVHLRPAYPEAWYNRGNALRQLGRHEESLASYDKALALRPTYVDALVNRGRALVSLGRLAEAVEADDHALRLRPDHPSAMLNKAITLLSLGDYAQGFSLYEVRWREAQMVGAQRHFAAPMWDGRDPLDGRALLLHAEQGLGDTIQFCRYATPLAERGARVILEVQPPLVSLLETLAGVSCVRSRGDALPEFDYHCPMLSLPLACGTTLPTIPAGTSYLRADSSHVAAWEQRLGPRRHAQGGLRIGLIATGNPQYAKDRNRSIPFVQLSPLLSPEREFVCLQKELRQEDLDFVHAHGDCMRSFAGELTDFATTAALTACMDLVITVDTSGAHLAGALGKPLWLMLPFAADWRWLQERTDSPWYPSARLFRQPRPGDWDSVIAAIGSALRSSAP
jgi:tetratricopeptide (TPR) repeat protein